MYLYVVQLLIWIAVHDANAWYRRLGTVDGYGHPQFLCAQARV